MAEIIKTYKQSVPAMRFQDISQPDVREKIAKLLKSAHENEIHAVEIMDKNA